MAANRDVAQRRTFAKGFTGNFSVFLDDVVAELQRKATATANVDPVIKLVHVAFCRCGVKRKRGSISRMNPWKTALMSLVFSASFGIAEDFKTIDGKVYKDATISHVEADGIVIKTKTGISKIYFVELPKDVQERFHYGSVTPTAKAVTQRIDEAQSAKPAAASGDADRFAQQIATKLEEHSNRFVQQVATKLDERESILHGKQTKAPSWAIQELHFNWAFLAGTAIVASVLFAIVWARVK